ncbi:MAG TPA: nucleotidyltransferase family protein [Rhizomicrobium sp.]|nr:nucleotidyltransferase family protein [Rhizomicrobium sp.]
MSRIAAVILAAGLSSRMGHNKLTAMIGGKPLLRRVAEAAIASNARPIISVIANDANDVECALQGLDIEIVRNVYSPMGLSTSLIKGINAVPDDCDGAAVLLGDMPAISGRLIDKLIAAFDPAKGRAICVATHRAKRGNPVLWSRQFFSEIRRLEGDVGAKSLLGAHAGLVFEVEAGDEAPLIDIDTPEALAAHQAGIT